MVATRLISPGGFLDTAADAGHHRQGAWWHVADHDCNRSRPALVGEQFDLESEAFRLPCKLAGIAAILKPCRSPAVCTDEQGVGLSKT